jgi:opacity protein-like surface antigen
MKGIKLFFVLILFFPFTLIGQSNYYKTDTSIYIGGENVINAGERLNSKICRIKKANKEIDLPPTNIYEYGFENGQVYVAKYILVDDSMQKVFLERLVKGKISLYFYRGDIGKMFFIEKDSSKLIEIPKRIEQIEKYKFQNVISPYIADCDKVTDILSLVSYTKNSLVQFIKIYNNCESKPFICIRYGLVVGFNESKLILNRHKNGGYAQLLDLKYTGNYSLGGFIDFPLFSSNFSLHTDIYLSHQLYSLSAKTNNSSIDFIGKNTTVNLPVLLRYTMPTTKIRPYFNAGINFTKNFQSDYSLYKTDIYSNIIEINKVNEEPLIEANLVGFSVGAGLEYRLNIRNSLFLETRYCMQYGADNLGIFNNATIQILAGFNF